MFKWYKIITILIFAQTHGMEVPKTINDLPIFYANLVLKIFDKYPTLKSDSLYPMKVENINDCHILFLIHTNTKLPWHMHYFYQKSETQLSFISEGESPLHGIVLYKAPGYRPELVSLKNTYAPVFNKLKTGWSFIRENNNEIEIGKSIDILYEEPALIYFLLKKYQFDTNKICITAQTEEKTDPIKLTLTSKITAIHLVIQKDYYQSFKEAFGFNIIK